MIPSTTNQLLVAEDWKKIYQSYKNADFKSYDFETLRRTMISYLRENYPEDFNDYIDSSEYIALIDLIAYLGQNLSFRVDLNARENFLETAERRESVLRLARLINYNAKRNYPASGLLKIVSVQGTDNVFDSSGLNLSNVPISWNDPTNPNWFEQFITILNSAMPSTMSFGKPAAKATVDGISTEKYTVSCNNDGVPVFSFNKNINGSNFTFEIVSSSFDTSIYEDDPKPRSPFGILYRNDNKGTNSTNSGFFVQFKQGTLNVSDFFLDSPVPNEIIGIDAPNINETDVWLWQLNQDGSYPNNPWKKVSSASGNNVIYNSLSVDERNLYSVITREDDQIDLNFTDGSFGNLPKGQFKLWYRQSTGISYLIKSSQMQNISFNIPYVNSQGQAHSISFIASLQYNVGNSSPAETNTQIKTKAPQAFYSQNRMVTAEDYNIVPLTVSTDILKVKTVNRISSGVSRYYELTDVSGKYSSVNIYGDDGIIYKEIKEYSFEYKINTRNEIKFAIKNNLVSVFNLKEFRNFYYEYYFRPNFENYNVTWTQATKSTNQVTGYFNLDGLPTPAGDFSSNNLKYVTKGSLVKFIAPRKINPLLTNDSTLYQQYFLPNGKLTFTSDGTTSLYKWAKVISIVGDGYNEGKGTLLNGSGPITMSTALPTGAIPVEVITKFINIPSEVLQTELVNISLTKRNFGISLDQDTKSWYIVSDSNIDLMSPFSLINQKDTTDTNKDASWMVSFVWTGINYKVTYRAIEYIFESLNNTSFFVDTQRVNYDYINDAIIKDSITVLGINRSPLVSTGESLKIDQSWQVDGPVTEPDGYQEPRKVKISFYDVDEDGQIDNPDSFVNIVNPDYFDSVTGFKSNFVFFKWNIGRTRYTIANSTLFFSCPTENDVPQAMLIDGQLFYFYDDAVNVIKIWNESILDYVLQTDYFARPGRSTLKFHYIHKAPQERRLDPSKTNLMDVYLLTKSYDTEFRNWLYTGDGTEPYPPTTQGLDTSYSVALNSLKSISDELVFQPAKYKILFGDNAPSVLQATFKATKNSTRSNSDNDLKTRILTAINEFFSIDNWDFGQTFYFSELSTYVMNILTPDITNFIIVPKQEYAFGSLYEIKCKSNEIFVSGATTFNIEIIDSMTTSQLKASGNITNTVRGQQ